MIATWVPAVLTPATPQNVSRAYRTALTRLVGAPSDLAVAVMHAHGALETWHFKSVWNGNAGNIKAGQRYEGFYCCIKLNEVLHGTTVWFAPEGELLSKDGPIKAGTEGTVPPGHPQTRMRAYETLAAGVFDKVDFLAGKSWRPALDRARAGDPSGYVRGIHARGYFTAPLAPYERSVVQLTQKYLPIAVATGNLETAPPVEPDSDELCSDIAACHRFELPPDLAARIRAMQAEHIDFAREQYLKDRDRDVSEDS